MIEHSMPTIGKEEERAIIDVLKGNYLAEGSTVRKFEEGLAKYIGSRGGVATSTGTLALHLALISLGVGKDDEIIIPSYLCRSVLNSILYSGARPVLCDVNTEDYNISPDEARKKITKKTKAIIVPHMFGCPAEIDRFRNMGVYVIEDCAHSIGGEYKGRKVGSWGDLSIFSFEGTKYIITGEGGMVLANSNVLLNKLKRLKEPNSLDYKIKYTYRMTNLQAAIGRVQLSRLNGFIRKRRAIAKIYNRVFFGCNIKLPKDYPERLSIYQRYMVEIDGEIFSFMKRCYRKGIKVKQPIKPYPLHRYLNLPARDFPNTEYIMRSAVSIPIYPSLTDKQIRYILKGVKEALQG